MKHIEVEFLEDTEVFFVALWEPKMARRVHTIGKGALCEFDVISETEDCLAVKDDDIIIYRLPRNKIRINP